MAECDVEVTTGDGRRWVVDQHWLRLPDNLSPTEEVRAAADALVLVVEGRVEVPSDLLGSWLDHAHNQEGGCCDFTSPCNEHEKALAVARHVLSREVGRG